MSKIKANFLAMFLGLFVSGGASAVVLDSVDQGLFYKSVNFCTFSPCPPPITIFHNKDATSLNFSWTPGGQNGFAIYDLTGISGTVTGGSINLTLPSPHSGVLSPATATFHEVTSSLSVFDSSYSGDFSAPVFAIYDDLEDGALFSSVSFADNIPGTNSGALTVAGLDMINTALGGFLAVGIDFNILGFPPQGFATFTAPQLDLEINPVPVPAAFWLFGTALLGLAGMSKRKVTA